MSNIHLNNRSSYDNYSPNIDYYGALYNWYTVER